MSELDEIKSHFALCVKILEGVCEQTGIDLETTVLAVSIDGAKKASVSLGVMLAKWKGLSE